MSDDITNPDESADEKLTDDELADVAGGCGPEGIHSVGEAIVGEALK